MLKHVIPTAAALLALALAPCAHAADASAPANAAAKKSGKKSSAKTAKKQPAKTLPEASPEQLQTAELVYYGDYQCEFDQSIHISRHQSPPGYAEVQHGKARYVMKPVMSTTGAVRLEDVTGRTLMVQIASKSMLMDVKAGRRLVDECISDPQREAALKVKEAAREEQVEQLAQPAQRVDE